MFEPDILITCDDSKVAEDYYDGAPAMTIETLSPSSRSKDFIVKTSVYKSATMNRNRISKGEIWIITQEGSSIPADSLNWTSPKHSQYFS